MPSRLPGMLPPTDSDGGELGSYGLGIFGVVLWLLFASILLQSRSKRVVVMTFRRMVIFTNPFDWPPLQHLIGSIHRPVGLWLVSIFSRRDPRTGQSLAGIDGAEPGWGLATHSLISLPRKRRHRLSTKHKAKGIHDVGVDDTSDDDFYRLKSAAVKYSSGLRRKGRTGEWVPPGYACHGFAASGYRNAKYHESSKREHD